MAYKYSILALKNIKNRGIRSWLTMLGIFIGIAAVVALVSLGAALETAISEQFVGELSPDRITISGKRLVGVFGTGSFDDDDVDLISSIRGVADVVPRYSSFVRVKYRGDDDNYMISNIPEESSDREMIYETYDLVAKEGRLIREGETRVIVIGSRAADRRSFRTKLEVGDNIEIEGENFRVIGILEDTGNQMIDQAAFLPQDEMERLLDLEEYHSIDVRVIYRDEIEEISQKIRNEIRDDRDQDRGEEDFEVETALEAAEAVDDILNTIGIIVIGIALISLFVGGVGITNTMYMSVLERRKEIGIMKSIGAKNKNILSLFLFEAGLMGLAGGIIGSFFGLSLAYLSTLVVGGLFPMIDISITLSIPLLLGVVLFSFLVGTLSGILPAIQASKLNPVDALRK